MGNNRPTVPCSCCNGTGHRRVSEALYSTLALMTPGVEITSRQLCAYAVGVSPQAMFNRLSDLKKLGLVDSVQAPRAAGKGGREHRWIRRV